MSQEQVRDSKQADHRSDLFSVGILFYELITGRRAFAGETGYDRMMAVLFGDPKPIEHAAPQYAHWSPFFARALAREPEARFQTASEMAAALRAVAQSGRMPGDSFGGDPTAVSPAAPQNNPAAVSIPPVPIIEARGRVVRMPRVIALSLVALAVGVAIGFFVAQV
jgi:serine/threonine-protein kinase